MTGKFVLFPPLPNGEMILFCYYRALQDGATWCRTGNPLTGRCFLLNMRHIHTGRPLTCPLAIPDFWEGREQND